MASRTAVILRFVAHRVGFLPGLLASCFRRIGSPRSVRPGAPPRKTLIGGYYDEFLDRVAEGRGPEREAVADTEARVYLGEDPRDLGLVDRIGTREDVEDALAERIGVDSVSVTEFADSSPTPGRGHRVRRR